MWEIPYVADGAELRGKRLYDALMRIKPDALTPTRWALDAGLNRGFFTNLKAGSGSPQAENIRKLLRAVGRSEAELYGDDDYVRPAEISGQEGGNEPLETVGIQHVDVSFGLGAAFLDSQAEIEVLQFPRAWVETITWSPSSMLTWARGRGDSMLPTIDDGDLLLLDRSQRKVEEQDALWAFTVGDTASIKRLRRKGDRFQILSDNPSVPPDEEPVDFVNIVARVVFVGKRK